ncbi:MAG: DUF4270 family protein [Mucilaginibacter sp.]|uniref:DUF4270 family protein n=1 Tax=Mucilaginibacter sp. L3T2-6 TaxID=3062491 RepID=UPI00267705CD|nr:DUF4270 family protein [Mucilaginibacter sp. L3T2-6]MDO3641996.1 DUF4270 family protein [Mucilaginibacter sp. L3T2-6]MDV6214326.1 DUF4270 family protein [Mucilaginibacter sp. L3T2-6]
MKFFRLDLLTLLISLFILSSCKNQDTIGLGVDASNQINGVLVDTSTIIVNTVKDDSLVTSGITKAPLAYFHDPVFGETESNLALSVTLPSTSGYKLPSGTISIDSARLIMKFVDGFYGDSITSAYKANLYQLKELFSENSGYYQSKQWQVNSNLLGSITFKARTHDSIQINNIIKGKPDSLIKVPAQLRIPVDKNFIIQNFFNASSSTLASNSLFQSAFKGLYLTLDKAQTVGAGGIFMLSNADTLAVFCKIANNGSIDTTTIKLPVTKVAASITHTYSTTINEELANTTTSRNMIYLQGLSGLRTKIRFPNVLANVRNDLLKRDSDIVLNRAELVITPSPGSAIPYRALPRLTMYQLDIAKQRIFVQDGSVSDPRALGAGVFGGFYSSKTNSYHFIITAYIQDLLLKKSVDYGTYIAPVDTLNKTSVEITPTPSIAARTVATGTDKSSATRIKLNIIYTKIAK